MIGHPVIRHRLIIKKQIRNKDIWQTEQDDDTQTQTSQEPVAPTLSFKKCHKNACRTRVTQMLEKKLQKSQKERKTSLRAISKMYLKKLGGTRSQGGHQSHHQPDQTVSRKVSWSDQGQFIYFSKRKNSASVSCAQKHSFALQQ